MEHYCGRIQGMTKEQAVEIAKAEGITYETFRNQGGAEVTWGYPCC